ncbi:hypothetical protein ACFQVC_05395 [Streptomyces monticola]|uniref:Uncharacterized protein n=1 Tax=Streptomyces monticola TaxID=2666263 RepID=A0ABW2JDK0_9ACTN
MEKRIDRKAPAVPDPTPLQAASTDPGYIPGITPAKPDVSAPEPEEAEDVPESAQDPDEAPEAAAEEPSTEAAEPAEAAEAAEAGEAEASQSDLAADADADGPEFEATDHRGSITVDGTGVRFRLDDQEAEFDWDELGAVEHATSRFGRRLTVTAHTLQGRAYPAEVQAPNKATLKRWETELDEALDAHFEE